MQYNFRFSGHFRKHMFVLAVVTGIIVSVSMPTTYIIMAFFEERAEAVRHSAELADMLAESVRENPLLWRYNVHKFTQVFAQTETDGISAVALYDDRARVFRKLEYAGRGFFGLAGTSPIIYNNKTYGYVRVYEEVSYQLYAAAGLFLFFSAIGAAIAVTLCRYPTMMVVKAEQEREKTEAKLRSRIQLEKLINSVLTSLVNLNISEIDSGINRALKKVGEFCGADRCYIYLFSNDCATMINTHMWSAATSRAEGFKGALATDRFPWLMQRIRNLKNIYIEKIEDLPERAYAEKDYYTGLSVRSTIQVPMVCGKSVIGLLGLDATAGERKWSPDTVMLLKIVGGILANAVERKRSGQALQESEARLRRITENMLDVIVHVDLNGIVQYVSPSYRIMLGYEPECLIGRPCFDTVHREDKKRVATMFRTFMQEAVAGKVEFRTRHIDGRYLWVEAVCSLLYDDQMKVAGVIACVRDITERKHLQQEVARLDRMHLIGEMAAGIGHEIRNPMTTVRGFLQMLRDKKESGGFKEYYDLMIDELDRVNSIIKEYLYLAKNRMVQLDAKNLNAVVRAIYPLIQADASLNDKHVILDLQEVPDLLLDEKEIRQLIFNLARNGLEAMRPGGCLVISTYAAQETVVLAVRDQGHGIDAAIMDKLGTPFFTTKEQGTGLGLAVCYSIAKRHNASIKIETGPAGSTFSVQFNRRSRAERNLAGLCRATPAG